MNHPCLVRGNFGFRWLFFVAFVSGIYTIASLSACSTSPSPLTLALCQTQHLQLTFDTSAAATSNEGTQFILVNQSKESCTLEGYPALQLLDARHQPITAAHIKQVTQGFLYHTQTPHRFVLPAGGKAYFVVSWVNIGCKQISPTSFAYPISYLQVIPPHSQASLQIEIQFCAMNNAVEISPLEPGPILAPKTA